MPLKKVSQPEITAAALRRMAKDLILQAEALEAVYMVQKPRKRVEFLFSKENRLKRKDIR